MLRTVRQVLHTSLLTTGVLSLCWLPASFVFDLYLGWPTSQRDAGVLVTRGCVWLWHTQGINPSIAPVEEGVSFTIQVGHSTSTKGSLVPTYERSFRQSAYGPTKSVDVRVPLWLLAAICLAWPVTSLLLARRRRKGRGFAVEPDPDAAPPVIDRPAHRPSNLPPLPRMLRRLRNLLLMTGLLSGAAGCFPATGTLVPALTGRVVDAQGDPVPGAIVEVNSKPVARTFAADEEGRFDRAEETFWLLYVVPSDVLGPRLLLTARAAGAESERIAIGGEPGVRFFGLGPRRRVDLGDIRLNKPPPTTSASPGR